MMQGFQFSQVLLTKRQELQLTQEDIANYVGVSRAAVSKWEKGLSYPDISLLPKLATFFDISIDTLLGYEPQMTKERIEALYMKYAEKFATEQFENVRIELEKIKNEYYSCYPLLLKIVQLYINYVSMSDDKEQVLDSAFELTERVRTFAPELTYVQEATGLQGVIYILRGDTESVLELLGKEPEIDYGFEQMIMTAYSMQGNVLKANEVAQVAMFQKLLGFVALSTETLMMSTQRPDYFEETVQKVETLLHAYDLANVQINVAFVFYIKAAIGYTMMAEHEKALNMIQRYVETCEKTKFPLKLKGNDYFYAINEWIQSHPQLMMQSPRDEHSIKKDLLNTVAKNPVFTPLHEYEAFQHYVARLQKTLGV